MGSVGPPGGVGIVNLPLGVGSVFFPRSAPGGGPAVSSPAGRGAFFAPRISTAGSSSAQ
ncbi:Uncharacterised protein [Mycobacteroides abscessus]|nr:Uncharacterised protein [Mycobacteroides abscessus]